MQAQMPEGYTLVGQQVESVMFCVGCPNSSVISSPTSMRTAFAGEGESTCVTTSLLSSARLNAIPVLTNALSFSL
jgi:hypothetical protein